jgi:hypothetical protein
MEEKKVKESGKGEKEKNIDLVHKKCFSIAAPV